MKQENNILIAQLGQAYRRRSIDKTLLIKVCNANGWDYDFIGYDDVIITQKQNPINETIVITEPKKAKKSNDFKEAVKGLFNFFKHTGKLLIKGLKALGDLINKVGSNTNKKLGYSKQKAIKKEKNILDEGFFKKETKNQKKNILDEGW